MITGFDRGFPRAIRLRRSADFRSVQREGRRVELPHLVVRWQANALGSARFGVSVSRRVGNAVVRNRVKRWLREAIRHERGALAAVDVVFIARSSSATAGYEPIRNSVARAVRRIAREQG